MTMKDQLIRDHRTHHRWFRELSKGKLLYNADKSLKTLKDVQNNHGFIVRIMLGNKVDHYLVDGLDDSLDQETKDVCMVKDLLKLPREYVIAKDFVFLGKNRLSIDARMLDWNAVVNVQQGIDMIKRVLKEDLMVEYPPSEEVPSVPVYDLALVRRVTAMPQQPEDLVRVWLGNCSEKPEGFVGMSNVLGPKIDVLIDYNQERIPYMDNSVSELVFCRFLSEMYSPGYLMKEAHRVLIDGGYLYIEEVSLKAGNIPSHPMNSSNVSKEFFAFWVEPRLLGKREKFDLIEISEVPFDDEFKNIVLVKGSFRANKKYKSAEIKQSDVYDAVNVEVISKDNVFGTYEVGLKKKDGTLVNIGMSYPTNLDLNVKDKAVVLVNGLSKDSAQQIIICNKAAENQDIDSIEQALKDDEEKETIKFKVLKQDKVLHLVYGVVAEPDLEDSDGHWSSAEDIMADAHNYLARHRGTKLSHFLPVDSDVVESYLSPVDWTAPNGDVIKKDSWVVVMRVKEAEIWDGIEDGTIVGFSKGGLGMEIG